MFGGDVFDAFLGMLFGGVVDEDVEMAKFFNCLFYKVLANAFIADVADDRNTAAALVVRSPLWFLWHHHLR